jgi:hypothetical protein
VVDDRNRYTVDITNMAGAAFAPQSQIMCCMGIECSVSATQLCMQSSYSALHATSPWSAVFYAWIATQWCCNIGSHAPDSCRSSFCPSFKPLLPRPGVQNALVISRTQVGQRGTAGAWPSSRGIRGLITQSPPHGHSKHSALMSAINVTFVNYTLPDGQFRALEHCGKCKDFQVWVSCMLGKYAVRAWQRCWW